MLRPPAHRPRKAPLPAAWALGLLGALGPGLSTGAAQARALGSSDQEVRNGALLPGGSLPGAPPPVVVPAPTPGPAAQPAPPASPIPALPATGLAPVLPPVLPPPPTLSLGDAPGVSAPRLERRRRWNMVLSGTGIFAATWAADRLLANTLSTKPASWIPLIGPWWLINEQSNLAAPNQTTIGLLVIDGVLQAGGLTLGILGLFLRTDRMVINVQPTAAAPPPPDTPPPPPAERPPVP